jgi:hypothetical protein
MPEWMATVCGDSEHAISDCPEPSIIVGSGHAFTCVYHGSAESTVSDTRIYDIHELV